MAEGYVVEYVGITVGLWVRGCRAFEYPKWEQFKQTVRRDRGVMKLQPVRLHCQCCDCDCVVSLPSSGEVTDEFISYMISKLIFTNLQPSQYKPIK